MFVFSSVACSSTLLLLLLLGLPLFVLVSKKVREARVYVSFKYFDYFWTVLVSLGLECCHWLYENGCCVCMFD